MSAHLRPGNACLATLAFFCAASLLSFADRPTPPDNLDRVAVHGNVHPFANPANDVGRADPARILHGVSIYFKRTATQQAELEQLLADQQDRLSPNYHQWLTPDQFAERFGAAPQLVQSTAQWLAGQGLTVEEVSRSRDRISFSGTISQIEAALHTQMHRYQVGSELHIANSSAPGIPAPLADSIVGFRNLHDFRPHARARRIDPHFTSEITGNTFLLPGDIATIYDIEPLINQFSAFGTSIAIIGQTDFVRSDIDAYTFATGPSYNIQKTIVPNSGIATISPNDLTEADLDLEIAGGIAVATTLQYIFVGNDQTFGAFDALQYAIDNNVAPVISISYGDCEAHFSSSEKDQLQAEAQQANAQGQTIIAAAGDSGAADCDYNNDPNTVVLSATQGLAVDIPAAIPEVTGVGGNEYSGDVSTPTNYWISNIPDQSTALQYIPEEVWNDTNNTIGLSAGGGGISAYFAKPAWQVPVPGLDSSHRYVPDISFAASPNHDGYLICSAGSCVNDLRDSNDNLFVVGGTSAGAPAFAAMLTLIEKVTGQVGLGNINGSYLYPLAANPTTYAAAFNDVTQGNNIVPCVSGPGCPIDGGTIGFAAVSGYDLATGLGSLDAFNFEELMNPTTPGKSVQRSQSLNNRSPQGILKVRSTLSRPSLRS